MSVEISYRKTSWTIPADVLDSVQERIPRGQVSAYVTTALRNQLERDNLAALVDEMQAASGPVDEVRVAAFMDDMR
jgi:thymidine phosphorylase